VYKPTSVRFRSRISGFCGILFAAALAGALRPATLPGRAKTAQGTPRPATLYFTVRDGQGSIVKTIAKDQVQVGLDGVPQQILSLSTGEPPEMSLGLLLDWSGSRRKTLPGAELEPAAQLLGSLVDSRRFAFAVKFNQDIDPLGTFANSPVEIEKQLARAARSEPRGSTALYDAIVWASRELAKRPGRKVLIVFAEGDDNASIPFAQPERAIEAAQRANAAVYFVSPIYADPDSSKEQRQRAMKFAEAIVNATGGRPSFVLNRAEVAEAFLSVGEDLRNTYAVTYQPGRALRPRSLHSVSIRIAGKGLSISAPQKYFVTGR
jgi:VWFA-related protein